MKERYELFMWMRSPTQALDEIAHLIYYQAPLEDQDAWLKAVLKLDLAQVEGHEEEE